MLGFEAFQRNWLAKNKENIEERQRLTELENERRIKEEKEKQKAEMEEKVKKSSTVQVPYKIQKILNNTLY